MNIGSLAQTCYVEPPSRNFLEAFEEEDWNYIIAVTESEYKVGKFNYFLEEDENEEDEEEEDDGDKSQISKFLSWLKVNAWQKPRAWLARMIKKLNDFAVKIRVKESTSPKRGFWSKLKEKIAKMIIWLTDKMGSAIRPDKIGNKENEDPQMNSNDDAKNAIDHYKYIMKNIYQHYSQ